MVFELEEIVLMVVSLRRSVYTSRIVIAGW